MARYYYPCSTKGTVEGARSISISFLKRHGYLNKGEHWQGTSTWSMHGEVIARVGHTVNADNNSIRFEYTFTNEEDETKKHQDYSVPIVSTPCHFGGVRYWFLCPKCFKRVGTLYLAGKYIFACRDCWNLTYESRNLGGAAKRLGVVKSCVEIDKMREQMRTPYYRGEFTKRHRRIIKAERRLYNSFAMIREKFGLPEFPYY